MIRLARRLRLSVELLAAHRLRTALGVSALLVGVATVVVMAAIGAGAERRLVAQVQALGTDLLLVSAAPAPAVAGRGRQVATHTTLRPADAAALAASPWAIAAAPAVQGPVVARAEGLNAPTTLTGTTSDGLIIRNLRVHTGRPFDEREDGERRRVVLLGAAVARNLFGTADPVGRPIRIGTVPFEVIGVLRPRGTDAGGADLDNVVVVPLETAMRRVLNIAYVQAVAVRARGAASLPALEADVRGILAERHPVRSGMPEPFVVQNQAVLLRTARGASRAMDRLTTAVAALALVLGGAGIATVMLASVRARAREIGLRRAVGARRRDIRLQFVLESGILATVGGAAGVALGVVAAGIAAWLGPWDLVLSWRAAVLGVTSATALGLVVGVAPAVRAARLEPLAALRA